MRNTHSESRRHFLKYTAGAFGAAALSGPITHAEPVDRSDLLGTSPALRVYLVYDRDSGKILHRHRQTLAVDAQVGGSREHILSLVDPTLDRNRLDVLAIEETDVKPGTPYHVNTQAKTLEELSGGQVLEGRAEVLYVGD